jgi:hypothetical protein
MSKKITWEWLEPRLDAVNVTWLEIGSGLRPKRLNDVKRGKSKLSEDELERIRITLTFLSQKTPLPSARDRV